MTDMTQSPMANRNVAYLDQMASDAAWELACDAVDYPVRIKELHWMNGEEQTTADGFTNTGRPCKFYGVVVDRNRDGSNNVVACVTGLYDTLAPAGVYSDLKRDLDAEGIKSQPRRLYVSGTGGSQILTVDLKGMSGPHVGRDIAMSIQLVTSVDGSKAHHCRLIAHDIHTGAEIVGIQSETFNVTARHTKTIKDRHAAFSVIISALLQRWNTEIMPFIEVMMDSEFDKATALDMLEKIMKKAKIPDQHVERCMEMYENDAIESDSHTVYGAVRTLSCYIEDSLADKPERAEKFRNDIAKKSSSVIQSTMDKLRK